MSLWFEDCIIISDGQQGMRVDQLAARLWSDFSREQLKSWMHAGKIRCKGINVRPSYRVKTGESLDIGIFLEDRTVAEPENIPLEIIYEDDSILVLNKPAGLVVHPGAGNPQGTLMNGLLYLDASLAALPRAGLVHRLDKNTSGLMVVARTAVARESLISQLKDHSLHRVYQAFVAGVPPASGEVNAPIGRHVHDRIRMAVHPAGKPALTYFQRRQTARHCSHMELRLATGRTHQIRVHMHYLGYPLLGDPVYAGQHHQQNMDSAVVAAVQQFGRQALHASALGLRHPLTNAILRWEVDLPTDMTALSHHLFS